MAVVVVVVVGGGGGGVHEEEEEEEEKGVWVHLEFVLALLFESCCGRETVLISQL